MRSDDLRKLAGNPNFISGIYNYCDRWCERCPFTSRCFLRATEQADRDLDDPEVRDITNEKFWRKLHAIYRSTAEMIAELAAETGVDLNAIDVSEEMAEHERQSAAAEQSELSQRAQRYIASVENWFRGEFGTAQIVHDDMSNTAQPDEEDITIEDAVAIIRWYQFFIAAKLLRALAGSGDVEGDMIDEEDWLIDFSAGDDETADDEDSDYETAMSQAALLDSNGSAKIALIAIDRSIGAWRALQISLPEKSDTIRPLLIELDRLRVSTEETFPRARDFIRPGFDEAFTNFVS